MIAIAVVGDVRDLVVVSVINMIFHVGVGSMVADIDTVCLVVVVMMNIVCVGYIDIVVVNIDGVGGVAFGVIVVIHVVVVGIAIAVVFIDFIVSVVGVKLLCCC